MLGFSIVPGIVLADEIEQSGWGDLTVNVTDIKNSKGAIRMALFNSDESYQRSGDEGLPEFKCETHKPLFFYV